MKTRAKVSPYLAQKVVMLCVWMVVGHRCGAMTTSGQHYANDLLRIPGQQCCQAMHTTQSARSMVVSQHAFYLSALQVIFSRDLLCPFLSMNGGPHT